MQVLAPQAFAGIVTIERKFMEHFDLRSVFNIWSDDHVSPGAAASRQAMFKSKIKHQESKITSPWRIMKALWLLQRGREWDPFAARPKSPMPSNKANFRYPSTTIGKLRLPLPPGRREAILSNKANLPGAGWRPEAAGARQTRVSAKQSQIPICHKAHRQAVLDAATQDGVSGSAKQSQSAGGWVNDKRRPGKEL
jgi:hypothetical protein